MSLKTWWRANRKSMLADVAVLVVKTVGATLRFDLRGAVPAPNAGHLVICGWHGKSVPFAYAFRDRGYVVMISNSNDGDMQNRVFSSLGFRSLRGSSGRGGERALVGAIRALREGATMAMTPDGPRGPSGEVQPGVVAMAQRSGSRLVATGIAGRPGKRAKSWDRFLIPLPFSRVMMIFGEPFAVPVGDDPEPYRRRLQREIDELEDAAALALGLPRETVLRASAG